jgi:DNA-binding response OmpR family regulator
MTEPETPALESAHKDSILLVEDNDAAGKGLAKLLDAYGFNVRVVPDGSSALTVLSAGPPPDFLLTDLQLPDFDGRDVARRARAIVPGLRIALITGWDLPADPAEVARWGIDWMFAKPLDVRAIVAKLRDASARHATVPG